MSDAIGDRMKSALAVGKIRELVEQRQLYQACSTGSGSRVHLCQSPVDMRQFNHGMTKTRCQQLARRLVKDTIGRRQFCKTCFSIMPLPTPAVIGVKEIVD